MMYDNNKRPRDSSNFTQSHNFYTFSQKEFDPESSLSYFGARSYDPFSGTWTTQDIVRGNTFEPPTLHRYQYVLNNPLNLIDRFGFEPQGIQFTSPFEVFTSLLLKKPTTLVTLTQSDYQDSPESTTRSSFEGTLSLNFSTGNTALTGNFEVAQSDQSLDKKSTSTKFVKGEGGTELLGASSGYQLAGASVQDNTIQQIINVRKVNGQGDRFLTPQSKFYLDEQAALAEARRIELELKAKERNQRYAELIVWLEENDDIPDKEKDYLRRSFDQLLLGNYTQDVTLLGTGAQVGLGFTGVDILGDIRDLSYDLSHWKWSWGHTGQTLLDVVGLVPVLGVLKNVDEVGALIKAGKKAEMIQTDIGIRFKDVKYFQYSQMEVKDVIAGLKKGTIKPEDIPIGYVTIDGRNIVINNRSFSAVKEAGVKPSFIDLTFDTNAVNQARRLLQTNPEIIFDTLDVQ